MESNITKEDQENSLALMKICPFGRTLQADCRCVGNGCHAFKYNQCMFCEGLFYIAGQLENLNNHLRNR